jgi:hypothetical protein
MREPTGSNEGTHLADTARKRPYHPPVLRDLGHLQEVTKTNASGVPYDTTQGGPNIYGS